MNTEEYQVIVTAIRMVESLRNTSARAYVSEQFTALQSAVDKYIGHIYAPSNPPYEVKRAIVLKYLDKQGVAEQVLHDLSHYGGYFGFARDGMFHGVEPDGYIHT